MIQRPIVIVMKKLILCLFLMNGIYASNYDFDASSKVEHSNMNNNQENLRYVNSVKFGNNYNENIVNDDDLKAAFKVNKKGNINIDPKAIWNVLVLISSYINCQFQKKATEAAELEEIIRKLLNTDIRILKLDKKTKLISKNDLILPRSEWENDPTIINTNIINP